MFLDGLGWDGVVYLVGIAWEWGTVELGLGLNGDLAACLDCGEIDGLLWAVSGVMDGLEWASAGRAELCRKSEREVEDTAATRRIQVPAF